MRTFSITMTVAVNVTVDAKNYTEARSMALGTPVEHVSEFDRRIDLVEDITPKQIKPRKGRGSY